METTGGCIIPVIIIIAALFAGMASCRWQVIQINARCTRRKEEIKWLQRVIRGLEKDIHSLLEEVYPDPQGYEPTEEIDWNNDPPY